MKHLALGDINISRVVEFEGPFVQPHHLLPESKPEVIESHKHWLAPHFLDANGMFIMSIHTYVIRTKHHTILVDTCVGNDKDRSLFPSWSKMQGPYLQTLEQVAGVKPEQVDYVLCTHLHVDHVGWNTRLVNGKWVPTFPNAKYLFARKEWEFWKQESEKDAGTGDGSIVDSVVPIVAAGKAVLVEGDHAIDDQVFLEPTPGHTPGHVCVHVKGGGKEVIMTGDMMHHPVQTAEPQWSSGFCADPKASAATRRAFLERNADTGRMILAAHFATPTVGTIVPAGNAFRLKV
ncbi:MAG: MBL fold metallo-hydrolase [Deltaproteobacteria bacterium]|nr:MBL fold metallo-hydrolase [Deltaproteobacteria bacterium]